MTELTRAQSKVLEAIRYLASRQGYPPTIREIGARASLSSTSTVHAHIRCLQKLGYIKQEEGKTRTIRVK